MAGLRAKQTRRNGGLQVRFSLTKGYGAGRLLTGAYR